MLNEIVSVNMISILSFPNVDTEKHLDVRYLTVCVLVRLFKFHHNHSINFAKPIGAFIGKERAFIKPELFCYN